MRPDLAQRIYQQNLDAVSAAVLAGDLQDMMNHIAIPNMMATHDCEIVMTSPEELDMVMQDFRAQLLARGVHAYRRTCIEARFVAGRGDMIAGRHSSEGHCTAGRSAISPYMNHSVLMLMADAGRGSGCRRSRRTPACRSSAPTSRQPRLRRVAFSNAAAAEAARNRKTHRREQTP
jgi:hypothetical protein